MIETRLPSGTAAVARLHANESAVGPPSALLKAFVDALHSVHQYPEGARRSLVETLAHLWKVAPDTLLITNGVDDAIDLTITLADSVLCTVPGFDAFWARAELSLLPVTRVPLDDLGQPAVSPDRLAPHGLAFIARPNNPTGTVVHESWLTKLAERIDYLVVDETYIDFADTASFLDRARGASNILVYRSLSKAIGLAGLRLGALIAPAPLAARLRERQRYYSADILSLQVAQAALTDPAYLTEHRRHVLETRPELTRILRQSGLFVEVRDTETNFVIARCADPATAAGVESKLERHGVRVRECSPFGYPGRIRVSVGTPDEMRHLTRALARIAADAAQGS